ncbi:Maf family protein [Bacillus sonorensis]|uniref:dTTP/UTP pyrophosphatase n=2 Tax=Bacillus sonorensis TaxID=119858 RepID=M5PF58_9BACI|nr:MULTISPECIES: nucleoside triphosphate pyrophosphatase [Bacillus]TWK78969.1 Septum formation protein Maf [Bacillus paralicheniformis]ASB88064.1 Maf-like protein [Bacillus sonorensis]EME75172.1 Maf-like protein [Bacillus sonorensis L12]MBG9915943.1 septum formation protein Maf [Bacillus sonorensis]MCF7617465.1 Maf-like protein [Bacillus sonorensis]
MTQPLILASQSPRRKELLNLLQIPYSIVVSDAEEKLNRNFSPAENVKWLAEQKVRVVADQYPDAVVLGADTIVCFEGVCLGKPKDAEEAERMLKMLSGQTHSVLTGVCIKSNSKCETFFEETEVTFWPLDEKEISAYIDTGEPFDKAGAYGIQGKGALFVKHIKGDYYSVVGLPISKTMRMLKRFGLNSY